MSGKTAWRTLEPGGHEWEPGKGLGVLEAKGQSETGPFQPPRVHLGSALGTKERAANISQGPPRGVQNWLLHKRKSVWTRQRKYLYSDPRLCWGEEEMLKQVVCSWKRESPEAFGAVRWGEEKVGVQTDWYPKSTEAKGMQSLLAGYSGSRISQTCPWGLEAGG